MFGGGYGFPVRELLYHSPQTRGWQTPRFCTYPQELVLRLEFPSKVQQIQILSHEYKIASKVEVFVATPNPGEDANKAAFKRLGYLSFDSNERSNHQARELKSVHVNVPAVLIRLVIHRCHVNKLNIYNQVGLIALNLIGEPEKPPMDMPPGGYLQLHPPITKEVPYYNAAAADVADINLDIHVDSVTASKIRELARLKDMAVANEDYDEAKRLKASIDRLKVVGQKIAQLEARKRAAVEKEDYDAAKLIKVDIDKLRATGESAAGTDLPARNKNPEEIFNRVLKGSKNGPVGGQQVPHDEMPIRTAAGAAMDASVVEEEPQLQDQSSSGPAPPALAQEPSWGNTSFGGNNKHQAYDERPAQGRGRYTPSEDQMGGLGGAPAAATRGGGASDIPAPDGWPGDLPGPEPLEGATAKDAEPLEELAGEYVARAFYSKNWQLRDAALSYLSTMIKDNALQDKRDAFRTLVRTVQRGMKDKVANVFLTSLSLFQCLIDGFSATAGSSSIQSACDSCLPLLIEKLGDNNARLREAAKESIMFIAGLKDANLRSSTHLFVKPIKNQNAWRPVLGILGMLQDLVPLLGISKTGDGFELAELMDFVGKAYNSPNADVRSTAIRVTKEVHDLVGPAIRKCMPKDINPKIKEQLDAVLGGDAAPAMPAPPPPATKAAPKAASKTPAKGAAGGSKAAGRGSAAPPPPPPEPEPMPAVADDPAPFEEELRAREKQLGPNHPDVAASCSNLAILYNSKGNAGKALPLYERALKIYEKHYGPNHPEVAHTLTDLAVMHLEAGRDDVGRPLLERALAIQESALGPDHPDVIAIKEVLNSE
eukprot:CAMPEP_0202901254 /NCGR_PEP_ID=MMETSP1392-20130828/14151_1 /ASSEMBLY_ACC=CAM_ASM_000868 /TAXON_ID=225041 /ORGANISM="Chlamydomonas chlamydogama, Strain SAG 11-48b" /LENGTH=824 /DNA_ID=CAMNT_0049587793 /DNA_START=202 /DNA_END=2677 /DNA_ORIENTATION=+